MYKSELLEQAKRILADRGLLRPADDEVLTAEIKRRRRAEYEDRLGEAMTLRYDEVDEDGYTGEDRAAFRKQVERALRYRG